MSWNERFQAILPACLYLAVRRKIQKNAIPETRTVESQKPIGRCAQDDRAMSCALRQVFLQSFFLFLLGFVWGGPVFAGESPAPAVAKTNGESVLQKNAAQSGSDKTVMMSETTKPVTILASRLPGFDVPAEDVPGNVTLIPANLTYKNAEAIYQNEPRRFQEALRDAEGAIFFDEVGNDVDTTFGLRGFSEGSSVIVLVDGVRVNEVDGDMMVYPLLDFSHIDSVQIDRGSASPIFGSGAFGGVVQIRSGRPSKKKLSLFGGFELSSFKGLRFYQGFSGTIPDRVTPLGGAFTYYFQGGRHVSDGFRDNGEYRITSFDMKAGYELPDNQGAFRIGLKHVEDAISNPGELPFDLYKSNPWQTLKPLDGRKYKMTIFQMEAEKKFFDEHLAASILSAWRLNRSDFYTTSVTFADGIFDPDTNLVTTKSRATDLIWQLAYQDEWRWLNNLSVIGMEQRFGADHAVRRDAFRGLIVEGLDAETDRSGRPNNTGLFWRETLKFFDRVIAHAGMRHDFDSLRTRDAIFPEANASRRWRASTVSTGVTVKPLKWTDLFANYSQGFRVPTISEIAPFGSTVYTDLRPEKSDSYEVGTRVRMREKAQLKFSYFLIDLKDEIVYDSTAVSPANPFGANTNIGQSRRDGIELRLDARPVQEVELYGSYTWTKAWVRKSDGGGSLVSGRSLGQVPENRITVGATVWPLKRLGQPFDGLRVSMNGVFTGRQHPTGYESTDQATLDATGGAGHFIKNFLVWDFMLAYALKGCEAYFKINNIFDARYYSRSVNATVYPAAWGGATVLPAGTYNFVNPGPPREFLLGLRWEI